MSHWYERHDGQLIKYFFYRDDPVLRSRVIHDDRILSRDILNSGILNNKLWPNGAISSRLTDCLAKFLTFVIKETIIVICEKMRRTRYVIITENIVRSAIEEDEDIRYIVRKIPLTRASYYRFSYLIGKMLNFMYPLYRLNLDSRRYLMRFVSDLLEYIVQKIGPRDSSARDLVPIFREITTEDFFLDFNDTLIEEDGVGLI